MVGVPFPFGPTNPLLDLLAREAAKRSGLIDPLINLGKRTLPYVAGPMGPNEGRGILGAQPRLRNVISKLPPRSGSSLGTAGPETGTNPLAMLFEQLLNQLQQPINMPTGVDTANLMGQVRSAIDPIYDQRSQEAQARTTRGREDIKGMYRALANDYERLAPEQAAQAQQAQADVEALYGELRSNIEGNYSRVAKEQGALFKQLGIEAALPDVLEPQSQGAVEAANRADELGTINQQRYLDQANIDETYYREGSPLATLTGTNVSQDLLFELNNYLNQLEAERTSGIQTAYTDLLGQAQNNLLQQQQMASQEQSRRQGMLWDILKYQMELQNAGSNAKLDVNTFMATLPPELQQSVASAFTRLQRSPEAIYGKTLDPRNPVPGTFVETTPQWFMAQADEMLRRGEIDQNTYQALMMYLQLHYGG